MSCYIPYRVETSASFSAASISFFSFFRSFSIARASFFNWLNVLIFAFCCLVSLEGFDDFEGFALDGFDLLGFFDGFFFLAWNSFIIIYWYSGPAWLHQLLLWGWPQEPAWWARQRTSSWPVGGTKTLAKMSGGQSFILNNTCLTDTPYT